MSGGGRMLVALHRGTSWVGKLIEWQTRSVYSHAALVFDWEAQPEVIEAREFHGVRVLDGLGAEESEQVDFFSVEGLSGEQERAAYSFALAQVGKAYDYTMVARFVTRRQEARGTSGKWFCSELVFAAVQKAGVKLLERTEPWEVSPGLLSRSPLLRFRFSIGKPQAAPAARRDQIDFGLRPVNA